MTTKHTPGPWETSAGMSGDAVEWQVCGPTGDIVASLLYNQNAESDARLIAAAPDLLAFAAFVHDEMTRAAGRNYNSAEIQAYARRVIAKAKATGE